MTMLYQVPFEIPNYGLLAGQQHIAVGPQQLMPMPMPGQNQRKGKRTRRGGRGRNRRRGRKQQAMPIMTGMAYGQVPFPAWTYAYPPNMVPPPHMCMIPHLSQGQLPPSRHQQAAFPPAPPASPIEYEEYDHREHEEEEEEDQVQMPNGIYLLPGTKNVSPRTKTPEDSRLETDAPALKQEYDQYEDAFNYGAREVMRVTLDDLDADDCSFSYDDEEDEHSDTDSIPSTSTIFNNEDYHDEEGIHFKDETNAWRTAFDQQRVCVSTNTLSDLLIALQ